MSRFGVACVLAAVVCVVSGYEDRRLNDLTKAFPTFHNALQRNAGVQQDTSKLLEELNHRKIARYTSKINGVKSSTTNDDFHWDDYWDDYWDDNWDDYYWDDNWDDDFWWDDAGDDDKFWDDDKGSSYYKSGTDDNYVISDDGLVGYVVYQYYSGDSCTGDLTYSVGLASGTCVDLGGEYSYQIIMDDVSCDTLKLVYYYGDGCIDQAFVSPLTGFTTCNTYLPGTFQSSVMGYCSVGTAPQVMMDSSLVTVYDDSYGCGGYPISFNAYGTDICMNLYGNVTYQSGYDYVTCNPFGNVTTYTFPTSDTCEANTYTSATVSTLEQGCYSAAGMTSDSADAPSTVSHVNQAKEQQPQRRKRTAVHAGVDVISSANAVKKRQDRHSAMKKHRPVNREQKDGSRADAATHSVVQRGALRGAPEQAVKPRPQMKSKPSPRRQGRDGRRSRRSLSDSAVPTDSPTVEPSMTPTTSMPTTMMPTTESPTTVMPSVAPTMVPTTAVPVTTAPSAAPFATEMPTTTAPSAAPFATEMPTTTAPSAAPFATDVPTVSTLMPSVDPTASPSVTATTAPSTAPSVVPSVAATTLPSVDPSMPPTLMPSNVPSVTLYPSQVPSVMPSAAPTVSMAPTAAPSMMPVVTTMPSATPTAGTNSVSPSPAPTLTIPPTRYPSQFPISGADDAQVDDFTGWGDDDDTPFDDEIASFFHYQISCYVATPNPTLMPTTNVVSTVSMSVVQVINGISLSTYTATTESSALYTSVLEETIVQAIYGISTASFTSFVPSAGSGRRLMLSDIRVLDQSGTSTVISYTVVSSTMGVTYNTMASDLDASVSSGQFNNNLNSNAGAAGATALLGCTSGTPTTTDSTNAVDDDNDDNGGSNGVSGGAIAGIVIAVVIVLVCVGAAYYFFVSSKQHEEPGPVKSSSVSLDPTATYGRQSHVPPTENPVFGISRGGGNMVDDNKGM